MGYGITSTNTIDRNIVKRREIVLKAIFYTVAIFLTLLSLYPFLMMLWESFKYSYIDGESPLGKIIAKPSKTFAKNLQRFWSSYKYLAIGLGNSLLIAGLSTILNLYVSALTAYSLTAYEWKLRTFFNGFIMVAMMLPTTIGNMGILLNIFRFGLTNKLFIFILPAMATPLTVFFMRMYLQSSFSKEMVQSARIDGAGEFRIFNQIILPLMKPALATQAIFAFAASWTDSEIPSLTIAQMEKKTIPMMFNPIYYLDVNDFLVVLALALPPIILYAFMSRYIVEGIALGGLKE